LPEFAAKGRIMARQNQRMLGRMAVVVWLTAAMATSFGLAEEKSATTRSATQQLHDLLDEEWNYELSTRPEQATAYGDTRYNDRLNNRSAKFYESDVERRRKFLEQFEAIDPKTLSEQDQLSRTLMIRDLKVAIEAAKYKPWEMSVNQMDGPHLQLPDLVSLTPFNSARDYDNYLARLHQLPHAFEQIAENLRQGIQDRLMPPRYLLEKAAQQAQRLADTKAEDTPFAKPVKQFPATVNEKDQTRLRAAILAAIANEVIPAYKRFAKFLTDDYAPKGRQDPGIWSVPDGGALYRANIRRITTTDLSPEEIHQLGLQQIAEIEAQMLTLAHKLDFQDLASLNDHVRKERSLYAKSGTQVRELYAHYAKQMGEQLPKLFGRLPKNKLIVVTMDPFRSPTAVPADYTAGAADGSRPGRINVNEYDPEHRLLLNVEAIAYHEGVPGHHLQISIAQELEGIPTFRRHGEYTAFVEGWALYSERLGKEIGFYEDSYSDYGRLENEMWRAIRLVVDTGVHEKHWSRDQMVELFHRYTAMDEPNVQTEVDRYIAWPGQALAYKLGQLEILKLREAAKQKRGDKFDLKAFHDEILGSGALPLDVLDARVKKWIEEQGKN
jgi:uncharacterized protein (DUF885 family)